MLTGDDKHVRTKYLFAALTHSPFLLNNTSVFLCLLAPMALRWDSYNRNIVVNAWSGDENSLFQNSHASICCGAVEIYLRRRRSFSLDISFLVPLSSLFFRFMGFCLSFSVWYHLTELWSRFYSMRWMVTNLYECLLEGLTEGDRLLALVDRGIYGECVDSAVTSLVDSLIFTLSRALCFFCGCCSACLITSNYANKSTAVVLAYPVMLTRPASPRLIWVLHIAIVVIYI